MQSCEILLTLWPPTENQWPEIEELISKEFEVVSKKTFCFPEERGHWPNFIIELYRFCYEPSERCRHPDMKKMLQKADYMSGFSKRFKLLAIKVDNPQFSQVKNGNPYGIQEVKILKNNIREKIPQIPRFSVIHSFDTPVRNKEIVDFINSQCNEVFREKRS